VKRLKDSYPTSPAESETEEYCVKSVEWLNQANFTNGSYSICIKKEGIRVEFPSDEFLHLEEKYFNYLL